jgi:hypothetical protein
MLVAVPAAGGMAALALFVTRNPQPPLARFENAKAALQDAAETKAHRYAPETYHLAEQTFQDGWLELARQNGRLRFLRDYALAESLLALATAQAGRAAREAADSAVLLSSLANGRLALLRQEINVQRDALDSLLRNPQAERQWSLAHAALLVTEALIREGAYEEALGTLAEGTAWLEHLEALMAEYLSDEEQQLALWRRWIEETLSESRRGRKYAVIVDKTAHKLYLANAGKLAHTYDCELGRNPAWQKRYAGDGATPEGKYRVTAVKLHGSKYYKALLLDYPNRYDRERFTEDKTSQALPPDARLGAFIEIHGEGGQKTDWTDGCVALTNQDMDAILKSVTVGTPVTVVRKSDQWP